MPWPKGVVNESARYRSYEKPYIVLEDVNMDFTHKQVKTFDSLIKGGYDLHEIAKKLKRSRLETLLLYLDRLNEGKIENVYKMKRIHS